MYTPDRTFVKDLKLLDKRLDCEYDPLMERFVITYDRAWRDPVPVLIVDPDAGYPRQPDKREINMLWQGDNTRISPKERLLKSAKYMEDYRTKRRAYMADEVRGMTKDGVRQIKSKIDGISGSGKGNATFRRIKPKQRGKTAEELTKH